MVVSSIFYFHPYLGKIPILTNIFQMGWSRQPVYYIIIYKCFYFSRPYSEADRDWKSVARIFLEEAQTMTILIWSPQRRDTKTEYIHIYTNCGTCPQKTETMKLKQHWYAATTVSTLFYSNRCLARWNTGIPKYSIRFFRKIPLCLATKRQGDDVLCEAPYGTETNGGNIAWMVPYHAMVP